MSYLGAVSSDFFGLYHAAMAGPTDRLEVGEIVKKIEIAFMRFDVMHDCGLRLRLAALELASASLTGEHVS